MGAGHTHALYVHEHTRLHQLAPEAKLVGAFGFVLLVAITPREAVLAFAIDWLIIVALMAGARLTIRFVAARMAVVLPFLLFAVLVPFIAGGETVEVFGITVSRAGLWGAWNIVAKATLGVMVSILLAATTEVPDLLRGLSRLRVPAALTSIASFMVRYLEVIAGELGRMRTAMAARAYDPRWLWQVRPIAVSAGALFIRSYERGERVHAAMVSRGYAGSMPTMDQPVATPFQWAVVGVFLAATATVTATAFLLT
jgi:cobalt/nickel transport system permease protein